MMAKTFLAKALALPVTMPFARALPRVSRIRSLHAPLPNDLLVPLSHTIVEPPPQNDKFPNNPVVILPGLFGSKQNWRSLSKALAQQLGTKVAALDLRNHGESPHSQVHDYKSMANDVSAFVASQGWLSADVIGHSM
eukprot:jgi/Hompol1/4533/HPOL_000946-RA